jgi:probable rRNA maturation factor
MRLRLDTVMGEGAGKDPVPVIDADILSDELGAFAGRYAPDGCREMTAALSFVSPETIREMNSRYRNVDQETDVLSFPLWETQEGFSPPGGWDELPLGDIVISPEYIYNSAKERNIDYNSEIILVIIHGALHLLGFDHDTDEREREMWSIQETLVERYFSRSRHVLGSPQGGLMAE